MPRITAFEGVEPQWFTPSDQDDIPDPLQFHLQPLNPRRHAEVSLFTSAAAQQLRAGPEALQLCLEYGVIDWRNFATPNGASVAMNRDNLDLIPTAVRFELFDEIMRISTLSGDDQKN